MTKPEIELSDLYLNLSIETGTSYEGSFIIYSKNGQELSGKVLSTNDKIVLKESRISGTECEIPFYFKGKMAIPGEEHVGDFLLITNGGEVNLPYSVHVVPKKLRIMDQTLSNLKDFKEFAKENWTKAKEIFYTREFHDVFFSNEEEYHDLYHGLLKGQSKDVILDNFLMEATRKEPIRLDVEPKEVTLKKENGGNLVVTMHGWGYIEGKIYGKYGNLELEKQSFDAYDFEDEKLTLPLQLKEGKREDILVIETIYQRIEVAVNQETQERLHAPAALQRKKEIYPLLLRYYVKLRTGKMTPEEYLGASYKILPEQGNFYELYRFQLSLIEQQVSKKEDQTAIFALAKKLEENRQRYLRDEECRSYYYYLMSLYKKDRASLMEAAMQIRDTYEKSGRFSDYLLLLMVDQTYALDFKGQCDHFYEYLKKGETSPLLYLGLLDVLNREPYYLEQLEGYRSSILMWGFRHEYLSLELTRQFAGIALKEKYYSRKHLDVLLKLYQVRQDESYLKGICSLCIKGNKADSVYHRYFEDALKKDLKIVGLNEYYIRTLDFSTYPELPMPLLYYFHYSNSLDKKEKAYLYANILYHKEKYEEILPGYLIRMEQFVREQMMEGRMNRYLLVLYKHFLPEILKDKEMAKYLPNILFKKKMTCNNPSIEGVYICQDEREEIYVPIVNGVCQIEQYSVSMELYFVDGKANRYHYGIGYQISDYLNEEEYKEICIQYNSKNNKVLLKWMEPAEKSLEKTLELHYEEKNMRALSECLDQINYRVVNPAHRRNLMNYYMACNRMEDAYFGAELYGSDMMDVSQLYLLTMVGLYLHKEEKDDLLLVMAHRSFIGGKYNKEILTYLRTYYEGRNFDLIKLWHELKKEGLDTVEYEERVLNQITFTGEREEGMLDVLLSYLEKRENDDLTVSMLEIYSLYYFFGRKNVPKSYFSILDRQAARENGLSFISKLAYLLRKATEGYALEERTCIKTFVKSFCEKHMVFDFFDAFESFVDISPILKEMTGFYCYSEEGKELKLSVVIENQQKVLRVKTTQMEEMSAGFYYGQVYLLADEVIKEKRVFCQEEEMAVVVIQNQMQKPVKNSRRQILAMMDTEKRKAGKTLEEYETLLSRMDEQLIILG